MNASDSASDEKAGTSRLLYGLHAKPPLGRALFAALAHLLAIVASIVAAPLIIAGGLGLPAAETAYVVSAALTVSGIATLIQVWGFRGLGSGLLSVQGTSFTFIGPLIYAGSLLGDSELTQREIVGVLLGSAAVGAGITMVLSLFLERLQRVVTPNVTGATIFLLGLTLVGSAVTNLRISVATAAESAAAAGESGVAVSASIWLLPTLVVVTIVGMGICRCPWLRLASICAGLAVGFVGALLLGVLDLSSSPTYESFSLIQPLYFPLGFDSSVLLVLLPVFLVTVTESVGDLTATSALSGLPVAGRAYWKRVRGGVLADGLNSVMAATFGTFPNTTFSQNNGVIQLTGVASRYVGVLVALLLLLFGTIPLIAGLMQLLPGVVLHAATGVMFSLIALAGLRLLWAQPDRQRSLLILVGSACGAFALGTLPELLLPEDIAIPRTLVLLLEYPVASGALLAMLLELTLPQKLAVLRSV